MRRRTLLASTGTALTVPSAGCNAGILDREDVSGAPIRLGWFGILNFDTERHRFDLRVDRGATTVHESSHVVAAKSGTVVDGAVADCTWGREAGRYTVAARIEGGDWSEQLLSVVRERRETPIDCAIAEARYRNGEVSIPVLQDCSDVDDYEGGCAFAEN